MRRLIGHESKSRGARLRRYDSCGTARMRGMQISVLSVATSSRPASRECWKALSGPTTPLASPRSRLPCGNGVLDRVGFRPMRLLGRLCMLKRDTSLVGADGENLVADADQEAAPCRARPRGSPRVREG